MARGRGRGGPIRGGGVMRAPYKPKPAFVPRHPFDFILCEPAFPRVKPVPNEDAFTQVCMSPSYLMTLTAPFYLSNYCN